ncbi:MAG: DUF1573 domain-containing protein, partial [Bacteroidales bacterium]|nr:DUF1573 domain-containing protein [Bacteroidales bacterium]
MFWTLLLAASLGTCGTRNANSAPVVELVAVEDPQAPETVAFDKTVHDFGDVSVTDGPLSCTFTLTNKGKEVISIYEVVSSCGCTDVKWTKGTIAPGQSGTISATYKNEDGPMPFDKTLTVYISGVKRPVVLRLRGVVHEKKKSLSQLYGAEKLGDFGLKARKFKTATLKQGLSVSETATVANLGKKPLKVEWADVSPQLSLSLTPNPIPAGSTATLTFTIRADSALYGKTVYHATPVLNGKKAAEGLEVSAYTQENFASWSSERRDKAPLPVMQSSTINLGTVKKGEKKEIVFECSNRGKEAFHIYKADAEVPALKAVSLPDVAPGTKENL